MLTAHRIELDPNNVQATYFSKSCGVARFSYNWALAEWKNQYEAYKKDSTLPKPTEGALRRLLNSILLCESLTDNIDGTFGLYIED